jgi:penicillin-binding protein 1A
VVLDPERDLRQKQRQLGEEIQVISPQNAYVMTSMLKKTVELGTLYNPSGWGAKFNFKDENDKTFRMPMAGKTGTPQNWSDAWTVGFSPYYTTAIWFGFDKPGNSLGVNLTGSTLAGPVWADYMREIHQGLSYKDFTRPVTGIIDVTVCAKSGLLKTAACNEGEVTLPFLEGTQPSEYCNIHGSAARSPVTYLDYMRSSTLNLNSDTLLDSLPMPALSIDLPSEGSRSGAAPRSTRNSASPARRTQAAGGRSGASQGTAGRGGGNRLLDGEEPPPPARQASLAAEASVREAAESAGTPEPAVDEAAEAQAPAANESAAIPVSAVGEAAAGKPADPIESPAPSVSDEQVPANDPEEEAFSPWFE